MSKFCGNCGFKLGDDARVCGNCGNTLGNVKQSPDNSKEKIVKIGIAALVVVLVIALGVNFITRRSYKKTIETYVSAFGETTDAEDLIDLFPEAIIEEELKEAGMSKSELFKELQEELDDEMSYLEEECDDWNVSWEIIKEKDASKSEIKYLSEDCKDKYDFKVDDKKDVTIELTLEAEKDGEEKSNEDEIEISLIKIGNKWYLWGVEGNEPTAFEFFEELV